MAGFANDQFVMEMKKQVARRRREKREHVRAEREERRRALAAKFGVHGASRSYMIAPQTGRSRSPPVTARVTTDRSASPEGSPGDGSDSRSGSRQGTSHSNRGRRESVHSDIGPEDEFVEPYSGSDVETHLTAAKTEDVAMYEQRRKALEQKRRARLEREEAMRAQEYERLGLARGNSRVAVGLVLEEDVDDGGHTSREPAPSSLKPERHDVLRSKYDMILPVCPYSRSQLLRILSTAFRDLPRADQTARKLLSKYHDRLSFAAQQRADGKSTASDDQAAASEGGIATATGTPGAKRGAGKAETTGGGFGVIVARSRQPEASQAHDDSDAMEGVAQELLSKPAQRTAETITKERINRAYQDRADGRKGGIGIPELLAAMDAPTSNSSHIDRGKLSAMAGRDSHMVLAVYPSVPVPTTSTDRLRAKLLERTSQLRRDWENYTTKLGLSRFNYSQTTMVRACIYPLAARTLE